MVPLSFDKTLNSAQRRGKRTDFRDIPLCPMVVKILRKIDKVRSRIEIFRVHVSPLNAVPLHSQLDIGQLNNS